MGTIDHLSKSERAVTWLVSALAGWLVHDLPESVPFMILDPMKLIGAERIASLVEYVEQNVAFWWLLSSS